MRLDENNSTCPVPHPFEKGAWLAGDRANNQAEGYSNMLITSLMENKKKKIKTNPLFCLKGMEAACCGAHGVCSPATTKIRRSHGASCIWSEKRQAVKWGGSA